MTDELVPLTAPVIQGLIPKNVTTITSYILDELELADLRVNRKFQRETDSPASRRSISAKGGGFDQALCAPLVVAINAEGQFEIIDGQHRAIAAMLVGITKLPCYIIDGTTLQQRAASSVAYARDQLPHTAGQIFRAEITAGNEAAVSIDAVCREVGVRVLPFSQPFGLAYQVGDTTAVATLRGLHRRRGADGLGACLKPAVAAGIGPIQSDLIKAVEALLYDEAYAGEMDGDRIAATLLALGPKLDIEVREVSAAKCLPKWRATVAVLFKHRARRAQRQTPAPEQAPADIPARNICVAEASARPEVSPRPRLVPPVSTGPIIEGISRTSTGGHMIDRRPISHICELGDLPGPGRSALDQRRASH